VPSDRIPSAEQLSGILLHVECLASVICGLLREFPEGTAPRGKTRPRDVAIDDLKACLVEARAIAAFRWPDPLPDDLRRLCDLVDGLAPHYAPGWLIGQSPPPDQFNVQEEGQILARLDELAASLRSALHSHTAKGTPKRPGRRRKKELTDLEQEVWTLYEKHRGEQSPLYEIVGILRSRFPGLTHDAVESIVRKIKARQYRASRKPAPRGR
jgi:hypothetical protein